MSITLHNHLTRDIKAYGSCPACDLYWKDSYPTMTAIAEDDAAYVADKARAEVADLLAEANKGADDV